MKKKIYTLSILVVVIAVAITVLFICLNNQDSKSVESTATEEDMDKEFSSTEITEADAMPDDYGTESTEEEASVTQKEKIPISCMYEERKEVELTWDEIEEEIEKGNYNKETINIDNIQKLYVTAWEDYSCLSYSILETGIDFEAKGLYSCVYMYLNEGPSYVITDTQMERVKDVLKEYIYDWDYNYGKTYRDTLKNDDYDYERMKECLYSYRIIIVDKYGRIEVYNGDGITPSNFCYFVEDMKPFDATYTDFPWYPWEED